MATATKPSVPVALWTESEKRLAEDVVQEARNYTGSFLTRFSAAAKKFGYGNYAGLPQGTRSFISSLGGKKGGRASKKKS